MCTLALYGTGKYLNTYYHHWFEYGFDIKLFFQIILWIIFFLSISQVGVTDLMTHSKKFSKLFQGVQKLLIGPNFSHLCARDLWRKFWYNSHKLDKKFRWKKGKNHGV